MQVQFAQALMEGLNLRPMEPAHSLHPVGRGIDPAVKAYRRKRQLAHRRARTQRMINRAKGKAYRYG